MINPLTRRGFLSTAALSTLSLKAHSQTFEMMNDASKLNPTPVYKHFHVKQKLNYEALRQELKAAQEAKRPLMVGAARHSMGGQSLPRFGTAVTLDAPEVELNIAAKTYRVAAGTRWFQVIEVLDKHGFSPVVMQSNSDFSVAATFSVNAHGWPCPYGGCGSTVRSLTMMLASGEIVSCSRSENAELFALAMGGYGLFGIILTLELDMVENSYLRPKTERLSASLFAKRFIELAQSQSVKMIYGRMNVAHSDFLNDAIIVSYQQAPLPKEGMPKLTRGGGVMSWLSNKVYRTQIGSETAKKARWVAETNMEKLSAGESSRNILMDESVALLAGNEAHRTDILHEYFVAPEHFNAFLEICRELIPPAQAEFLNVTFRYVAQDKDSVLNYATTNRIAAVMSFSQVTSPEGERDMAQLTHKLIERVGEIGGAFYLPYRLHASKAQMAKIYPKTSYFAEKKRDYDKNLTFRNALWETYFNV